MAPPPSGPDKPRPASGSPVPPALSVAAPPAPGAQLPRTALADIAAGAAAAAAVSAGITVGAFVAGTFGWAPPLVAASIGAAGISLVYFLTRKLFSTLFASFSR